MRAEQPRPADRRVGLRCDATPRTGVGHLLRCIALAEELASRGIGVVVLGDVAGIPWAARQLAARELPLRPAPADPGDLLALTRAGGLRAVVLDGYALAPRTGAVLRGGGVRVLAVVDGPFGAEQEADLYLDQNPVLPGSPRPRPVGWPPAAPLLAGLEYALLRRVVRDRRPAAPPAPREGSAPAVLAVFGGTDPHGAASTVVPLALAAGEELDLTVVAGRPGLADELGNLPRAAAQRLTVTGPLDDLPAAAVAADLVLSAAGSSVWELLCLGVATAVVCVTGNQELGYAAVAGAGLAAPLGRLDELRADRTARSAATAAIAELLASPAARAAYGARGWAAVDGRGRERVADALLALLGSDPE